METLTTCRSLSSRRKWPFLRATMSSSLRMNPRCCQPPRDHFRSEHSTNPANWLPDSPSWLRCTGRLERVEWGTHLGTCHFQDRCYCNRWSGFRSSVFVLPDGTHILPVGYLSMDRSPQRCALRLLPSCPHSHPDDSQRIVVCPYPGRRPTPTTSPCRRRLAWILRGCLKCRGIPLDSVSWDRKYRVAGKS